MPDLSKTVIKLASELLKHQAKIVLGDGFMNTLTDTFADFVGDTTAEKVSAFLSTGDNAEKLLAAFKDADDAFRNEGDDILRQMIASKPLAAFESLEKLANNLPQTLDSESLFIALRQRFEDDWSNQPTETHIRAAQLYRACLERALAARCNQILPAIFAKVERIEANTEKLIEGQREILDAIKSIQLSRPTTFSLLFTILEPPKDFIGRTIEIDELLANAKNDGFIIGLTGGGGTGKSALARLLAKRLVDRFPDARLEIDLQGVPRSGQVPLTIADVMRRLLQPFYPDKKLPDDEANLRNLYVGTFSQKRALLLLDNAYNAAQVRQLLPPAPSVALVTSRSDLSGLSANGMYARKINTLLVDDARVLLRTVSPRLQDVADEDADTIAKLCGNLPLALRVVGSLLQQRLDWKPQLLIKRLTDERQRLTVLKMRDDPDLDVEASLSLSYVLLSSEMQRCFQMLSVFPAPFDLKAVSSLWDEPEAVCDDMIGQFIRLSLLDVSIGDVNLYKLHDLTRLYADSLLSADPTESVVAHLRHAQYYADVIYNATQLLLKGGDDMLAGLQLFDAERKHIEAGQAWAAQNLSNSAAARACTQYGGRGNILLLRLLPPERIQWFEASLQANRILENRIGECVDIGNLGLAYHDFGEQRRAIEFCEQHLIIARELGNRQNESAALCNLGLAYSSLGELRKAIEYHEQALIIDRELGDLESEGINLGNLGIIYRSLGEPHKAIDYCQQALSIVRKFGDLSSEGSWLGNLGLAYSDIGDLHKAIECHEQSLAISRKLGNRGGESGDLGNLGIAYEGLGEPRKAIEYYEQQLVITREIGYRRGEANALGSLGNAYRALNEIPKAIEYYKQALATDHEIGYRRGEGYWLGNLGEAYVKLQEPLKAINYFEQALSILREIGDKRGEAAYSWSMGLLLEKQGEFRRAVEHMQMYIDYWRAIGYKDLEKWVRYLEYVRAKIK